MSAKSVYVDKNLATPESLDYELGVMSLVNSATSTMCQDTDKSKATALIAATAVSVTPLLDSESGTKPGNHFAAEESTETSKELETYDNSKSRGYSDFNCFHDFIHDENLDDLNAFGSSNEEDVNDDFVFYNKLKEEGEKRLRLEQENANLKRQITTLKEEMSIIKSHDSVVVLGDKEKKEGQANGVSEA